MVVAGIAQHRQWLVPKHSALQGGLPIPIMSGALGTAGCPSLLGMSKVKWQYGDGGCDQSCSGNLNAWTPQKGNYSHRRALKAPKQ